MSTTILVAIISVGNALIVGLTALFSALITSRQNRKAEESRQENYRLIERQRLEYEQNKRLEEGRLPAYERFMSTMTLAATKGGVSAEDIVKSYSAIEFIASDAVTYVAYEIFHTAGDANRASSEEKGAYLEKIKHLRVKFREAVRTELGLEGHS